MHERISTYWAKLNTDIMLRRNQRQTVVATSLAVVLVVFWCLKLTGVTLAGEAFCGQTEHVHGETCFQKTLLCRLSEGPVGDESVYFVSDDAVPAGRELVYFVEDDCTQLRPDIHFHSETCYERRQSCTLAEHTHDKTCYSDIKADLETREDWERLAELSQGSTTAANVVNIAQSQLGYQESERNFEVDADLVRHGITRYGQWYGNPYGDWSAMFASFCLYYAGVEDAPANAGPESMRLEWAAEDMYRPASEFAPRVGDVIFLRTDDPAVDEAADLVPAVMTFRAARASEPAANNVALIKEISDDSVTVIQGDVDGQVTEVTYSLEDAAILGYGLVPEVSAYAARAVPAAETEFVARTINYNTNIFTEDRRFVIYTVVDTNYYAMDGAGNAVPVYIDTSGEIRMDAGNRDSILWTVTKNGDNGWLIQNLYTNRYLHPYNNSSGRDVTHIDDWPAALTASGVGAQIRHTSETSYARLSDDFSAFSVATSQAEASIFRFGVVETCTVWMDGTYSNVVGLRGSDKSSVTVMAGDTLVLPTAWKSPEKYAYVLKGWYDVKNARYYAPGAEIVVTENLLFYPDWVASTYDIGVMNEHVVDIASTADYVTTHVFDFNPLFNTLSENNNYSGGDSAQWTLVTSGAVRPTGKETLDFIFVDYDTTGVITYPNNRNVDNGTEYTQVTPGLYDKDLADILFNPEVEVLGKTYLGTGDYLFRYCDDPLNEENYGYYFYDSRYNAASYNQSRQRFYVYDYLERTTDSGGNGSHADFLPLNSPYANTNGKGTGYYSYDGELDEYVGVNHISYDTKYSDNQNSTSRVGTNFWFGMVTEIDFYLSAQPGDLDENGESANKSTIGEDMVFEFSGDDDVWVLIDGELVLDIGGVHTEKSGSINFATGDVVVEGKVTGNVRDLVPGNHKLTMYYLERGGSMSNYTLRFNISPRYAMTLRKEDTLTAHMLNGAEFSIYLDKECTIPAQLWTSREAYNQDRPATNVFKVSGGEAAMWGFVAGGTYYIRETKPPEDYADSAVEGIVRLRLNNDGSPDYEVLPDENNHLTVGFTAHGFKVDEESQAAYLVISNTDATESPPTQVYVEKVWNDNVDHSGDSVTAYLLADGIRIQSVTLNEDNDWKHMWENLPAENAEGDPVTYTVVEATVPGYIGTVQPVDGPSGEDIVTWESVSSFEDGGVYLMKTDNGYIGANSSGVLLESSEAAAKTSATTRWVAGVDSDGKVTLTNEDGRTLYYDSSGWTGTFRASSGPGSNRNLTWSGNRLSYDGRYLSTINGVQFSSTSSQNSALTINLWKETVTEAEPDEIPEGSFCYRITNTPVGKDTVSLTVHKVWDVGQLGHVSQYEAVALQMKLLANGEDAGLAGTVALRTGWSCTFAGLPKYDNDGEEITYTVEEIPFSDEWTANYSEVTSTGEHAYEVTVTNTYCMGVKLPETVGRPPFGYTMSGALIILGALGWYCGQRRRRERGER